MRMYQKRLFSWYLLSSKPIIPISYRRWTLYLPKYYEYSKFEGLLKQVKQFSKTVEKHQAQINIPTQGQQFLFEKHLIVDGRPYVRGKYGQFLGDDIFLSLPSRTFGIATDKEAFQTFYISYITVL